MERERERWKRERVSDEEREKGTDRDKYTEWNRRPVTGGTGQM